MKKLIIGGCTKNVGRYLPQMFKNIDLLRQWFTDVKVIFAYDLSLDDTYRKLSMYRYENQDDVVILSCNNVHSTRTIRIASARNSIMKYMVEHYPSHDLFCFMDCDDIINADFKKETMEHMVSTWLKWDSLSFNREDYYDIWALRYEPYLMSCWAFGNYSRPLVIPHIQRDITSKLNQMDRDDLFPVESAFNGFAFFKMDVFKDAVFDGLYHHNIGFVNPFGVGFAPSPDDCEWVNFFQSAKKKHPNLRVMISPLYPY